MDKYIGRLLDNRYEILETIGTGGMAVVYKARCHRLNRLVAVKILKDDYMGDEEFRRRFHSESQAVAMLSHPNIVSVYDVSTSIMADYIVMELIDGITLKQYMEKKGVLNWKETLHFAIQIAKALEHAHSRGIVHRDIKPHNVMVLKNGSVKVTDFGIARVMSQSDTLTKEALGSVHYISPEQAKGGRVDNRSDIYSLGTVMYEMMSGRPPYDGESPVAVAIKHINGGAPMPSTLNPNIPGGLEQIIMHAMALDPSERYSTAAAMLRDLDEFRKDPGILFDYNVPPLDEVIHIQRPPLVLQPEATAQAQPKTIAEKTVEKSRAAQTPPVRRNPGGATPVPRRNSGTPQRSNTTPSRRRRDPKEEQRNKVATIATITCSVVLLLAIVVLMIVLYGDKNDNEPEYITVPNLVGSKFDSWKNRDDYTVELNDWVYSDKYEAGIIVDQTLKPDTKVEKDEPIYVMVSKGPKEEEPEPIKMPDLTNLTKSEAEQKLKALKQEHGASFTWEFKEQNHDEIPKNQVISTDPQKDSELKNDQVITLTISLGMAEKEEDMPKVVGLTKEEATELLDELNMGLKYYIEEVFHSTIEAGVVISSDPKAGEKISSEQVIGLEISKGPELVGMSDVVGKDKDEAKETLSEAGFKKHSVKEVYSDQEVGTVISVEVDGKAVEANTPIDVQKTVVLYVSKGYKTVTITLQTGVVEDPFWVKIYYKNDSGSPIFYEEVSAGTTEVVLENQFGSGKVEYIVHEEFLPDDWTHTEDFS